MSPEERREHAADIMFEHARDVERMSIREHLDDNFDGGYEPADVTAIYELVSSAGLTVEWPEAAFEQRASGDDQ